MSNYGFNQSIVDQERRRTQLQRTQSIGVAITTDTGYVDIAAPGIGEVVHDVVFSVKFLNEPPVVFGSQLLDAGFEAGKMPVVQAIVLSYHKTALGSGTEYVDGVRIGVYATGFDNQRVRVRWMATGKAFRNPVNLSEVQ